MTSMIQWEPFYELRNTMDRLFDQGFSRPWRLLSTQDYQAAFPIDIWESGDNVEVKAALPGIYPDDVDITVVGDTLTIKARHAASDEEQRRQYYVHEVPGTGEWQRTFTLPVTVEPDKAEASYEHGMLYLKLPKAESVRPRQIKVGVGHTTNSQLASS
jgi:HSP20 family protein